MSGLRGTYDDTKLEDRSWIDRVDRGWLEGRSYNQE